MEGKPGQTDGVTLQVAVEVVLRVFSERLVDKKGSDEENEEDDGNDGHPPGKPFRRTSYGG
jgi:hypothetical protein